jgi:hypothetical protein
MEKVDHSKDIILLKTYLLDTETALKEATYSVEITKQNISIEETKLLNKDNNITEDEIVRLIEDLRKGLSLIEDAKQIILDIKKKILDLEDA